MTFYAVFLLFAFVRQTFAAWPKSLPEGCSSAVAFGCVPFSGVLVDGYVAYAAVKGLYRPVYGRNAAHLVRSPFGPARARIFTGEG